MTTYIITSDIIIHGEVQKHIDVMRANGIDVIVMEKHTDLEKEMSLNRDIESMPPLRNLNIENPYFPKSPILKTYPVRTEPKIFRNQICPCGSGKKYKKCCQAENNL